MKEPLDLSNEKLLEIAGKLQKSESINQYFGDKLFVVIDEYDPAKDRMFYNKKLVAPVDDPEGFKARKCFECFLSDLNREFFSQKHDELYKMPDRDRYVRVKKLKADALVGITYLVAILNEDVWHTLAITLLSDNTVSCNSNSGAISAVYDFNERRLREIVTINIYNAVFA